MCCRNADHQAIKGSRLLIEPISRISRLKKTLATKGFCPKSGPRSPLRFTQSDRCQSGLMGTPGKRVCRKRYRGFESLSVRQFCFQLRTFHSSPPSGLESGVRG